MNDQVQNFLKKSDADQTHPVTGQNDAVSSLAKAPTSARWFNEQDWSRHRERVSNMYTQDDLSVSMIQRAMQDQFGLNATAKMFKDRFKAWNVSKNLRSDEVLALLRIRVHRNAVGDNRRMNFRRSGKPITEQRLERYLRDHPKLHERLRQETPDEALVDDLIESFLPSRGLVALSSPQKYLRNDEWSFITESTVYSLQVFRDPGSSWNLNPYNNSIYLLREGTYSCGGYGVMADTQNKREYAWDRIQHGNRLLEADMIKSPDSFAIDLLFLLSAIIEEGKVLHLGYQLTRHISSLSDRVLGPQSPYHSMFSGLETLMEDSLIIGGSMFKEYHNRIAEALIDVVAARVHSGGTETSCHETFAMLHDIVGPPAQTLLKATIRTAAQNSTSVEDFAVAAGTLAAIHIRAGEDEAAHILQKTIIDRCADIRSDITHILRSLGACISVLDWVEFKRLSTFLEARLNRFVCEGEDCFHALSYVLSLECVAFIEDLLLVRDKGDLEDQKEAHRAIAWLQRVGRMLANSHETARESARR